VNVCLSINNEYDQIYSISGFIKKMDDISFHDLICEHVQSNEILTIDSVTLKLRLVYIAEGDSHDIDRMSSVFKEEIGTRVLPTKHLLVSDGTVSCFFMSLAYILKLRKKSNRNITPTLNKEAF